MSDFQDILLTEREIANAVQGIAYRISEDYKDKVEEIVVVCILKGAFVFCADLVRALSLPVSIDFLSASSYLDGATSSGNVRIHKDVECDVEGKHVILVEDIVDTGLTLQRIRELFLSRNPASVEICCFLDKSSRREVEVPVKYCCFEIPDAFVVGYGLDYAGRYRGLPEVCILAEHVYKKEA